jgi:hypothetical protein
MIAELHAADRPIDRAELARFSTEELMPLVDAAVGPADSWWSARAFAALQADDAARWMEPLVARARITNDAMVRLAMIVFVDQLDGQASAAALRTLAADLEQRMAAENREATEANRVAPDHGAELLALKAAMKRREKK